MTEGFHGLNQKQNREAKTQKRANNEFIASLAQGIISNEICSPNLCHFSVHVFACVTMVKSAI